MAFDYQGLKDNTVIPLMQEFGKTLPIELHKKTGTIYDPTTGQNIGAYVKDSEGIGVQTDYNQKNIDGSLIRDGDKMLLAVNINEPDVNDRMIVDGVTWNIEHVGEVKPGSVLMLYKLQIRK